MMPAANNRRDARSICVPEIVLAAIMASAVIAGPASAAPRDAVAIAEAGLRAGETLDAALGKLKTQGFRIVYSSALVRPGMTLATTPAAREIESLLQEILSPWKLRALRDGQGDWLITVAPPAPETDTVTPKALVVESIETVDVTASRLRLAVPGSSEVFLDRQDVERLPHLADDAMRALKVLPGVTGGDISAALNLRGGRREETLLTIDGAKIHNAFHFRDIDGALSVLDTTLVDGIDFTTGGMTADVGDHMSGVVALQSRRPAIEDEFRSAVGVSFVSLYGRTSNTFAADRGSWLLSVRRGFLDVLTERVVDEEERLTPRYTDVFAATDFEVSDDTRLSARLLFSDDDLKFDTRDDEDIESVGQGRSSNLWFALDHDFSDSLRTRTMLAMATVSQVRDAAGTDDNRYGEVHNDHDFRFLDLRQDWTWAFNDRHMPRWGFDLGEQRADYDYSLNSAFFDPLISPVPVDRTYATLLSAEMRKLGVYGAWRARLGERLTAEAGGRWDQYRYDPGQTFDVFSPRLNLVYAFDADHQLRAAWGIVHQPQAIDELQVADNVTTYFAPEEVRHIVLGYSWRFMPGHSLRVDVYDKEYQNLRPRFENALDPLDFIPESAPDRIRINASEARARGVEVTLRRDVEQGFSGWVSLAMARAEDRDEDDWYSRSWEQRNSLSFGTSWSGANWHLSLAGLLHDGMPTTQIGVESTPLPGGGYAVEGDVGPYNGERYAPYARVDLRATRDVRVNTGKLTFYLEVTNLLNRENECCVEDYHLEQAGNNPPYLFVEKGYWLPMLPSFGVHWEF